MALNPPVLLLTRPTASALEFARALHLARDIPVVISPLLRIEFLQEAPNFVAAIFTSKNGVATAGAGLGRRAYCVGAKTAQAATDAGFDVVETTLNAQELIARIVSNPPQTMLSHIRGEYALGDIVANLQREDILCEDCVTYRQIALKLSNEARETFRNTQRIVAPLFSPRTASLFADEIRALPQGKKPRNLEVVALSAQVSAAIPDKTVQKISVCPQPTGGSMLELVSGIFND